MLKSGFTRKQVEILTLGEKMKRLRDEGRMSLAEMARQTKIQVKYLECLENGDYGGLPADVYVRGFLRSYASYLGIDEHALLKLYDREKGIQTNLTKETKTDSRPSPLKISTFIVTPKIIVALLSAGLTFLAFFYLYREYSAFVSTPRLVITQPANGATVGEQSIFVEGMADRGAHLFINDASSVVDDEGAFREKINLQPGLNNISIKASNKFGKETSQTVLVKAEYEIIENQNSPADELKPDNVNSLPLKLEIMIDKKSAWLSVEADGNLVYSGTPEPNGVQVFEAREKIVVASGNGKLMKIKVNGKDAGTLSEKEAPVRDMVFEAGRSY